MRLLPIAPVYTTQVVFTIVGHPKANQPVTRLQVVLTVEAVEMLDALAARWSRALDVQITRSEVARSLMERGMPALLREIERLEANPPPQRLLRRRFR